MTPGAPSRSSAGGRVPQACGIVNLLGSHTIWQSCRIDTPPATPKFKNPRFPIGIIGPAVGRYFRFCLSFRDVEELLFERGGIVTYKS